MWGDSEGGLEGGERLCEGEGKHHDQPEDEEDVLLEDVVAEVALHGPHREHRLEDVADGDGVRDDGAEAKGDDRNLDEHPHPLPKGVHRELLVVT